MKMFNSAGYETVGHLVSLWGGGDPWMQNTVILNNNSDTYLVVGKENLEDDACVLYCEFRYDGNHKSARQAFEWAITEMVRLAMRNH